MLQTGVMTQTRPTTIDARVLFARQEGIYYLLVIAARVAYRLIDADARAQCGRCVSPTDDPSFQSMPA